MVDAVATTQFPCSTTPRSSRHNRATGLAKAAMGAQVGAETERLMVVCKHVPQVSQRLATGMALSRGPNDRVSRPR